MSTTCESSSVQVTFYEGIISNFTVTVIYRNDSMKVTGILRWSYIFINVTDSTSCDNYIFKVTAVNDAGVGGTSETTGSFPSLPDITSIQESLQHSLYKTTRVYVHKDCSRIVPFLSCAPPLEAEQMIISISSDQSFLQRGWKL